MGEQEAGQQGSSPIFPSLSWAITLTPMIEGPDHRQPLPTPLGQPLSQGSPGKDKQTLRVGGSLSGAKGLVPAIQLPASQPAVCLSAASLSLEEPIGAAAKNLVPRKRERAQPLTRESWQLTLC